MVIRSGDRKMYPGLTGISCGLGLAFLWNYAHGKLILKLILQKKNLKMFFILIYLLVRRL